jgi:hypothetical protein
VRSPSHDAAYNTNGTRFVFRLDRLCATELNYRKRHLGQ